MSSTHCTPAVIRRMSRSSAVRRDSGTGQIAGEAWMRAQLRVAPICSVIADIQGVSVSAASCPVPAIAVSQSRVSAVVGG